MKRTFTLELQVTAPATVGEHDIEESINAALDEPPCDWGLWTVGRAVIMNVTKHADDEPNDDEPTPVRQTACRYCGLDIENIAPFLAGEWHDRGKNTYCHDGKHHHTPFKE